MFNLTKEQWDKFKEWEKIQDQKIIDSQKGTDIEHPNEAYYGAIGGGYSYIFTPTSLGICVNVRNNLTKEEINLTDYDSW